MNKLTLLTVLKETVKTLREKPRLFLYVFLGFGVLFFLGFLSAFLLPILAINTNEVVVINILSIIVGVYLWLVGMRLFYDAFSGKVLDLAAAKRAVGLRLYLKAHLMMLVMMLLPISFLFFIVPGFYFMTIYAFAIVEFLFNGGKVGDALIESDALVKPYFWRVLGIFVGYIILGIIVQTPVMLFLTSLLGPDLANIAVLPLNAVIFCFSTGGYMATYLWLKKQRIAVEDSTCA